MHKKDMHEYMQKFKRTFTKTSKGFISLGGSDSIMLLMPMDFMCNEVDKELKAEKSPNDDTEYWIGLSSNTGVTCPYVILAMDLNNDNARTLTIKDEDDLKRPLCDLLVKTTPILLEAVTNRMFSVGEYLVNETPTTTEEEFHDAMFYLGMLYGSGLIEKFSKIEYEIMQKTLNIEKETTKTMIDEDEVMINNYFKYKDKFSDFSMCDNLHNYAVNLIKNNTNLALAEKCLIEALKFNPNERKFHYTLAKCYEASDNLHIAIDQYEYLSQYSDYSDECEEAIKRINTKLKGDK